MADRRAEENVVSGQPTQKTIADFDPALKPKRNNDLHPRRPQNLRHAGGNPCRDSESILPHRLCRRRQDVRLDWTPIYHSSSWSYLFYRSSSHGVLHQLRFLMFGRFVAGIGVGYALMIAPVYTAEVSPASSRGFLTSFLRLVFINAGILFGYISNWALGKLTLRLGWRLMLGVGAVPSVFLALGVLAMPESPRWLVMQGRLGDAKRVLDRTSDSLEESKLRLADIKEAAGIPEHCNDDVVEVPKRSHGEDVWRELLLRPTPAVRHILIAGVGIHFFQQASGIDAVVLYSPRIFKKAGITNKNKLLLATIAVGFVKTVFILVATFFLDRVGRRPLLLSSMAGMVAALGCLGFGLTIVEHHSDDKLMWALALCIVMVLLYVAFFSIGMGPITWVYSSEIFPLKLRAQGCGLGVAVNRTVSGVISMTFLSLTEAITIGGAFFLYTGVAVVGWVFFYTMLPETRGRTLEDMEILFGKFHKWKKANALLNNKRVDPNSNGNNNTNGQVQLGTKGQVAGSEKQLFVASHFCFCGYRDQNTEE
ncbi:hypothetical protein M0R45_008104 [Rubus argutus]|uniref:Major facilitator superfamily (MFS) profile domain-containing protein n=1 Tax=Rubus argutus TaxID=59490 RepID=A0AAW1Y3Y5_RUBAR